MALKMESKQQSKEVKKLIIGFGYSLLEYFTDLSGYSPAEARSFFDAACDLWLLDPNRKRFIEKIDLFYYELEEERTPPFEIGRYIAKHLKN
ncbi:MAG TPA: hypothetical protein VN822_13050 [Candidatus Acidoferrales bacterium]|nr:hypothetical protein [Candidatus Acidoferrales bacterium]